MHYADGSQVEFPIVYGRDLLVMVWWPGFGQENAEDATIVWRGINPALKRCPSRDQAGTLVEGKELRLFNSVWENPRPEEEIVSIDYISTETTGLLPFLIAITME